MQSFQKHANYLAHQTRFWIFPAYEIINIHRSLGKSYWRLLVETGGEEERLEEVIWLLDLRLDIWNRNLRNKKKNQNQKNKNKKSIKKYLLEKNKTVAILIGDFKNNNNLTRISKAAMTWHTELKKKIQSRG